MKTLLAVMIVFSVIGGFSINGQWSFLYQFEFVDFPTLLKTGHQTAGGVIAWLLILIAHCGILALLFMTSKRYFWHLLVIAPLLFIAAFVASATVFVLFFLVPFIIVWMVALVMAGNRKPTLT